MRGHDASLLPLFRAANGAPAVIIQVKALFGRPHSRALLCKNHRLLSRGRITDRRGLGLHHQAPPLLAEVVHEGVDDARALRLPVGGHMPDVAVGVGVPLQPLPADLLRDELEFGRREDACQLMRIRHIGNTILESNAGFLVAGEQLPFGEMKLCLIG